MPPTDKRGGGPQCLFLTRWLHEVAGRACRHNLKRSMRTAPTQRHVNSNQLLLLLLPLLKWSRRLFRSLVHPQSSIYSSANKDSVLYVDMAQEFHKTRGEDEYDWCNRGVRMFVHSEGTAYIQRQRQCGCFVYKKLKTKLKFARKMEKEGKGVILGTSRSTSTE